MALLLLKCSTGVLANQIHGSKLQIRTMGFFNGLMDMKMSLQDNKLRKQSGRVVGSGRIRFNVGIGGAKYYYSKDVPKGVGGKPKDEEIEFMSQMYDESNSIDFHEQSNLSNFGDDNDTWMEGLLNSLINEPCSRKRSNFIAELRGGLKTVLTSKDKLAKDLGCANELVGSLKSKLSVLQTVCTEIFVLLDLRKLAETKYSSYWIMSPQLTTYRQEAQKILQKHQNVKYKPEDRTKVELAPEMKQKISLLFDDVFLKWIFVLFHSNHRNVRDIREIMSEEQLIQAAGDVALALVMVHNATHKFNVPKAALGLKPTTSESIATVLGTEYEIEDDAVDNVLLILRRKNINWSSKN